jgi:hypothetical protein
MHAEQRAMFDALRTHPTDIPGSTLYFLRLTVSDTPMHSGAPYCTVCSKMALDLGVRYFALWHTGGWKKYDTEEYNNLSYQYSGDTA